MTLLFNQNDDNPTILWFDKNCVSFPSPSQTWLAALISVCFKRTPNTFTPPLVYDLLTTSLGISLALLGSIHFSQAFLWTWFIEILAGVTTFWGECVTHPSRPSFKLSCTIGEIVTPKARWPALAGIVAVVQTNAVTFFVFARFGGETVFTTWRGFTATRAAIPGIHPPKKMISTGNKALFPRCGPDQPKIQT